MTIVSRFAGKCAKCGGRIFAGTPVDWTKSGGTSTVRHLTDAECVASVERDKQTAQPAVTAAFDGTRIAAFLNAAKARGLKFPKARFLAPGGEELRLALASDRSNAPGSINVTVAGEYRGRIKPDGSVQGRLGYDTPLLDTIERIAADPVKAATAYGALMGACSFCGLPLTDAGSVEVGYGPVCAKHWGLPHTPQGTPVLREAV